MGETVIQELFEIVPEIDFDSGCRYFLNNMDNYIKAMMSALKSIKSKLPLLANMYHTAEYEGLRIITQTLRRMMSNIGADSIAELSYQLETALINQEHTDIHNILAEYHNSLQTLSMHLEKFFVIMDIENVRRNQTEQASFLKYDFTKTKESIKLSSHLLERKII